MNAAAKWITIGLSIVVAAVAVTLYVASVSADAGSARIVAEMARKENADTRTWMAEWFRKFDARLEKIEEHLRPFRP